MEWRHNEPNFAFRRTVLALLVFAALLGFTLAVFASGWQQRSTTSAGMYTVSSPLLCTGALEFVKYEPSIAEAAWAAELVAKDPLAICPLLVTPQLHRWIQVWISGAVTAAASLSAARRTDADDFLDSLHQNSDLDVEGLRETYSILWHRDTCTGGLVPFYVEPLLGTMRDPRVVCGGWAPGWTPGTGIKSTDTIVLDAAFMRQVRRHQLAIHHSIAGEAPPTEAPPRVLVFDLGASVYLSSPGLESSLEWIVEERLIPVGLHPDAVFVWEIAHNSTEFFRGMPDWLSRVTRFLGAVTMDDGSEQNPLVQLRRAARPSDFVVFKLDIDFSQWEWAIVQALRNDASLGALVDVLFWEHHHQFAEMAPYWGPSSDSCRPVDSFREFSALRQQGIAAHVWP